MRLKDYGNSIKYFQRYASQKQYSLESKIKLAHIYSKVPQYFNKAIDILSSLLLTCSNNLKLSQEVVDRVYNDDLIESAVILLSSLYFKNGNVAKAIDICEMYNKINITNYRVMHILGGFYKAMNNTKKSFLCYISALQNNPSHSNSLIELSEYISGGY